MRDSGAAGLLTALFLLFFCGCTATHPHRVPQKQINRMLKAGDRFVLVFGSVRTEDNASEAPGAAVRFIRQERGSQDLLREVPTLNGDRFYAVLAAPSGRKYLDHFDTEVRGAGLGYDKVTYIRLYEKDRALAMYVGEIHIRSVEQAQRQILSITVKDDFSSATAELKRLYPKFPGEVRKSPLLRAGSR